MDTVTISIDRFKNLENKESLFDELTKDKNAPRIIMYDRWMIPTYRLIGTQDFIVGMSSQIEQLNRKIYRLENRTFFERLFNK